MCLGFLFDTIYVINWITIFLSSVDNLSKSLEIISVNLLTFSNKRLSVSCAIVIFKALQISIIVIIEGILFPISSWYKGVQRFIAKARVN